MLAGQSIRENDRSAVTKARIADAVIEVIAESGLGQLTHRRVAAASKVSLATTTYYYATKQKMVADASTALLDGYISSFRRLAKRLRGEAAGSRSLPEIAGRLLVNSAGRHHMSVVAWCEIILDAARTQEGHRMSRRWFKELLIVWRELAAATTGRSVPDHDIHSAIDSMIGMLFLTVPLGLSPERISSGLSPEADIAVAWKPAEVAVTETRIPLRATKKAQQTREHIIDTVIKLLIDGGPSAVTYKAIAQMSGMTVAAPAYHFGSIATLLECAEATLFTRSKGRYRDIRMTLPQEDASLDVIADLTTAIFMHEATQHGFYAIAIFSIWLEAARQPKLRREIWDAILDMSHAWTRRIAPVYPAASLVDGWRAQAVYIGRIVRILATGAPPDALAEVRSLFFHDLKRRPGPIF